MLRTTLPLQEGAPQVLCHSDLPLAISVCFLFDFVVIAGFGGQGLAYGVTARMSHHKWLTYPSGASFIASIVCLSAFGQPLLYLIAAAATVFTVVIPSIKTIESERVEQ